MFCFYYFRLADMTEVHSKEMLAAEVKLKQLEDEKDNLASNHAKDKGESENIKAQFQQR